MRLARRSFARFLAVGPIGCALGALQYELLWRVNPLATAREATTWIVSSSIGIAWIHAIHCRFTFPGVPWARTLGKAYSLYAATIALGAVLVELLERSLHRTPAWLLTTALTSLVTYGGLRRLSAGRARACAPRRSPRSDVTVVVPTKNERANVPAFLASIPPDVPLLVVDASDDATAELVMELRPANTRVVPLAGNIARARQAGAELAETEWLLFTDADVSFVPGYFDALRALELDPATGALFGTKVSTDRFRIYHAAFRLGQRLLAVLGIPAGSGSNLLVSRAALRDAGGFDVELSCNEDSEVLWRIRRAGWRVSFAAELAVVARDHRRLERGVARKLVHSLARCTLLYLGLLPRSLRRDDWGYWKAAPEGARRLPS